jgi:hypothetical protein
MTPQTCTEQEYMRVIYYEGIYLATMNGFFARAWGILLLSIESSQYKCEPKHKSTISGFVAQNLVGLVQNKNRLDWTRKFGQVESILLKLTDRLVHSSGLDRLDHSEH